MNFTSLGILEILFLLAPLLWIPLARHIRGRMEKNYFLYKTRRILFLPVCFCLVLSFFYEKGTISALLVAPWCFFCVLVLISQAHTFKNTQRRLSDLCFLTGCFSLLIGALNLIPSRLGISYLNVHEPIVFLTVIHFHYAGFLTSHLVGFLAKFFEGEKRRSFNGSIFIVLFTPYLIAVGFLTSSLLRGIAVSLFSCGLFVLSFFQLLFIKPKNLLSHFLLKLSSLSILAGITLAFIYAWGEHTGDYWITIPQMIVTHGLINSFGFVGCGLLGWNFLLKRMSYV